VAPPLPLDPPVLPVVPAVPVLVALVLELPPAPALVVLDVLPDPPEPLAVDVVVPVIPVVADVEGPAPLVVSLPLSEHAMRTLTAHSKMDFTHRSIMVGVCSTMAYNFLA
jgi:hypothetical protein